MANYIPPTIESYGGISGYLDATKEKHNGNGSAELKKYWNWGEDKHMNITALSQLFNVTWQTMDGWLDRLHKESKKPRADKKV
jgi:hypothetical protein